MSLIVSGIHPSYPLFMRVLLPVRLLAALLLWLGTIVVAHATHILGGELLYTPIASTTGVPRYHITARLYRDVSKIDQSSITLSCSRNGCDVTAAGGFTTTMPRTQVLSTYSLGCMSAQLPSYNVYLFEADVDLPPSQWILSVTTENRQPAIVNIFLSVNTTRHISAFLDNALVTQNASPKFISILLPYVLGDQVHPYSFSAFDSEGDSLVYRFVAPQQGIEPARSCGQDVIGFLPAPHFQINAASGALLPQAKSAVQGYYAMAVRVNEYRRVNGSWQQIGWITRDIDYVAVNATNQAPTFTNLTLSGNPTPQPLSQVIRVQPGQTVSLSLAATDPDAGQALRFESQAPNVVPGFALSTMGGTTAQVTWQVPASLPIGRYHIPVAVLDNGCPNASEEQTLSFLVTRQVLADRPAQNADWAAFPMPFRDQVQFRAAAGAQAITIIDGLGRVVARLTSQADGRVLWQPATALPAGLYVARGADGRLLARLLRAAD
jgi:hypothetical protein